MDQIKELAQRLSWPVWALETISVLSIILIVVAVLEYFVSNDKKSDSTQSIPKGFRKFQLQYFAVYYIIMLADWLQGTNMYTLYSSYGVSAGTLFLTGFLSSAIFGTCLGVYVDRWGRKLGCIIFCVLEIIINTLEHLPNMPALMVGRVLGGISTSLLFSAFESWMVSEHRKLGFSEDLLASTFSLSSSGNAVMAILGGFVAQVSADKAGDIGPFQVAIALTVVTLVLILPWRENYGGDNIEEIEHRTTSPATTTSTTDGDHKNSKEVNNSTSSSTTTSSSSSSSSSLFTWMTHAITVMKDHPSILYLGLSQAFFEGAVYAFVFMWVPSMLHVMGDKGNLPTGLVFASFMLSMSTGGMLFGLLLNIVPGGAETLCTLVYIISAISMIVVVYNFEFWSVYISFIVLEGMVGMFNSCGATLRSRYYPDQLQSTIMSVFRVPLNLLVVLGTLLTSRANNIQELQQVFKVIVGMHIIAALLQMMLVYKCMKSTSDNHINDHKKQD